MNMNDFLKIKIIKEYTNIEDEKIFEQLSDEFSKVLDEISDDEEEGSEGHHEHHDHSCSCGCGHDHN